MSIKTHSKFYYGFQVDELSRSIDFSEGGGPLLATIPIGDYTLTTFAAALASALNDAGSGTYTVVPDRVTRLLTIAVTGIASFTLKVATGANIGSTAFGLAGFTGADRAAASSHVSDTAVGTVYATQFKAQSYVASEDNRDATYGTLNKSASGKVEVITFGEERFIEMNLTYVTDIDHGEDGPIRSNPNGVADLRALMNYATLKAPLEFIPDEADPDTFETVQLESTAEDSKGLKFKLKELYTKGLPDYWETGALKFRTLE